MSRHPRWARSVPGFVEPELQQLLARANLEYGAARDEAAAYRRVRLALEQRCASRWQPWLWALTGVAAAAIVALVVQVRRSPLSSGDGSLAAARLSPEPPVTARPPRGAAAASADLEPAVTGPSLEPALERGAGKHEAAARGPRPSRPSSAGAVTAPAVTPAESHLAPAAVEQDCLALARDGSPRPAERCFERRSQGTGLSAEMALYELARLRRDVLGDGLGALSALGDYRERFPAGSLRNEVDVSRIELLVRLGRGPEALTASERLLATPSGQERGGELRLLRGNVYRASGALREAAREYAGAERFGGSLGEEATFLRAQCLEALGVAAAREADARPAQPAGPHRSEARQHLDALAPRSR